jgi:hypothetical protein
MEMSGGLAFAFSFYFRSFISFQSLYPFTFIRFYVRNLYGI